MGKIIVVTKRCYLEDETSKDIDIFTNDTGKKLRIYRILYTGGVRDSAELNVYLKIGEMKVFPYEGSLYNIGGTTWVDADIELDPNSTLKLHYDNNTTTTFDTVIVIVAEVVE